MTCRLVIMDDWIGSIFNSQTSDAKLAFCYHLMLIQTLPIFCPTVDCLGTAVYGIAHE